MKNSRQTNLILMLADIRQDIKHFNLTGVVPDYASETDTLADLKRLESHYAMRAYELRNGISK